MKLKKTKSSLAGRIRFGCHGKEEKSRKEKTGLVEGVSILSRGRLLEEELQALTRVIEEGASYGGRRNNHRC